MKVFEALLDLNKAMMIEGYKSDYKITFSSDDFEQFASYLIGKERQIYLYPQTDLRKVTSFKLAGPGCYFWIYRETNGK